MCACWPSVRSCPTWTSEALPSPAPPGLPSSVTTPCSSCADQTRGVLAATCLALTAVAHHPPGGRPSCNLASSLAPSPVCFQPSRHLLLLKWKLDYVHFSPEPSRRVLTMASEVLCRLASSKFPLPSHRPPSVSPTCGMPQGLRLGCSSCLPCSSQHSCSPTPVGSFLRCYLT